MFCMSDNYFVMEKVNGVAGFASLDGRSYEVSVRPQDVQNFCDRLSQAMDMEDPATRKFWEVVTMANKNFIGCKAVFRDRLLDVPGQPSGLKTTTLNNYHTSAKALIVMAEVVNIARGGPPLWGDDFRQAVIAATPPAFLETTRTSLLEALRNNFARKPGYAFTDLFRLAGCEMKWDNDPTKLDFVDPLGAMTKEGVANVDILGMSLYQIHPDLSPIFLLARDRIMKSLAVTGNANALKMHLPVDQRHQTLAEMYADDPTFLVNIVAAELNKLSCLHMFGGFLGKSLPLIINAARLMYLSVLAGAFNKDLPDIVEYLNSTERPDYSNIPDDGVLSGLTPFMPSVMVSSIISDGTGLQHILSVHGLKPEWDLTGPEWKQVSSITPPRVLTVHAITLAQPDSIILAESDTLA